MRSSKYGTALLLTLLFGAASTAGTIEKKFPDGKLRLKYAINEVGDRNGFFNEYYPTGKLKVDAAYKGDQLEGPYKSFHPNGKAHITTTYKGGKLDGTFTELSEAGLKVLSATYKDGQPDGAMTRYDQGKPLLSLKFHEGNMLHQRSLEEIKRTLDETAKGPAVPGANDEQTAEAMRRLQAYRYLAEVPYANLEIDEVYAKKATAAAKICELLGKLSHEPANPGLPEAEYKIALEGARNSQLAFGLPNLHECIDIWMFDSDAANAPMVLHRRNVLQPTMRKVGLGQAGKFSSLWTLDDSQKQVAPFDAVCWPARGLMPVEFLPANAAWNVTLNPDKYSAPTSAAVVKIFAADAGMKTTGEPLPLNILKTHGTTNARPMPSLIFRPEGLDQTPGKRYLVEIDGLTLRDGKTPAKLVYIVEFTTLK